MRKIQFRGKSRNNDKWAYGDLFHIDGKAAICPTDDINWMDGSELESSKWCWVDPETVGQFTGLCDKNETPIYEGDIVRYQDTMGYSFIGLIGFNEGRFGFVNKRGIGTLDKDGVYSDGYCTVPYTIDYEVIGNIHDNPELLK